MYENRRAVRIYKIEGDDHCYNFHLEKVLKAVKEFLAAETEIPVRQKEASEQKRHGKEKFLL